MAKGWTTISISDSNYRETKAEQVRKHRTYESMMSKIKPRTTYEMKKDGEKSFADKVAAEDSLVAAYQSKRLKSKKAIKQAEKIIKFREKHNKTKE